MAIIQQLVMVGDVDLSTTITISNSTGEVFNWSSDPKPIDAILVKASTWILVYKYNPAVYGDTELYAPDNREISHVTFCWNGGEPPPPPPPPQSTLSVIKFYDADADGIRGENEVLIEGWQVNIDGQCAFTSYTEYVDPGTYEVTEDTPKELNWMHTTPTVVDALVEAGKTTTVEFGNLCLGAGGGKTMGFWSNNNGYAVMNDGGTVGPELSMLIGYNLRNAKGEDFNPADYDQFRSWLLSASATNMAYMLSAQFAAMALNVEANFVSGSALVYAGACGNTGVGNEFITIADLMAAANTSLGSDGNTKEPHPQRAYQECLKNALDKANNNKNFVQPEPCPFSFYPVCEVY